MKGYFLNQPLGIDKCFVHHHQRPSHFHEPTIALGRGELGLGLYPGTRQLGRADTWKPLPAIPEVVTEKV